MFSKQAFALIGQSSKLHGLGQPKHDSDFSDLSLRFADDILKIIKSFVTVMTWLQYKRNQPAFAILKLQKQPFSGAL